jgi:endonuclease YncB( thermonuclease family)
MGRSNEEIQNLEAGIAAALANGHLNAWQTKFLTDIRQRLEQYGARTVLSDKQVSKLNELIGGESVALNSPAHGLRPNGLGPSGWSDANRAPRREGQWWKSRAKTALVREGRWWARRMVRDLTLLALLIVGGLVYSLFQSLPQVIISSQSQSASLSKYQFAVTDGDTVQVNGETEGTRLVGFNAPETYRAECGRERALGIRATARLKELVGMGDAKLVKVPCACANGTEGTDDCNYRRSCGVLRVNGRDVGQILVSERLAVPFVCGTQGCPPAPRPWCGS